MSSPPALPGLHAGETPIDRALTLRLAGEAETALRWAAAALQAEPELPTALLLVSQLLSELGRRDPAREGLEACVVRAIDAGILPLAVAACVTLREVGVDASKSYDAIADAFHAGSARLDDDSHPQPPPPPKGGDLQPLSSLLMGPALLNKAVEILRNAASLLKDAVREERESSPPPMIPTLPLFSALSRTGLRALIEAFGVRVVPAGGVVIEEGTPGTEAFIVARGELEVKRGGGGERADIVLARLQSGQVFGEMALVSRSPRAASVIASRPSLILAAPVEVLESVASKAAEVGEQLAKFCRERMLQNLVRTSPMLRAVAPEERIDLVSRFETRTYEAGEALIRRGDASTGLHLIASGEVEVVTEEGGDRLVLASLGPGEVVGEVGMILRRPAMSDVVAVHPSVTLHLSGNGFHEMLRQHPRLLAELYDLAVKRDEETSSVVAQEATSADDYVLV
ncbi:MAG: cyclic nucleotide-binding domain-containing protein [Polyangiales bacterium]